MSAWTLFSMTINGILQLATLWKMEMQYYGKITCNFVEKVLAKNTLPFNILLFANKKSQINKDKNYFSKVHRK